MIRATVKVFQRFPEITERVERAAREGLDEAATEAAAVAQAGAHIDLEIEVIPAHGDVVGYSAGIKSRKHSRWSTAPLAGFFDRGTLGKRTKPLKRPRKASWPVNRRGTSYTAHRAGDLADKGVEPERFFGPARSAGRRKLLARLARL